MPEIQPHLLLSFDLEDWHQLVARDLGCANWDAPNEGFERQLRAIFGFLDGAGAKATFFLLGITMKNYPEIVAEIVSRGDEIACHGFGHDHVFRLSRDEFERDLDLSLETIARAGGPPPRGYRAPAFSINRDTLWAFDVLVERGFEYDASQYDSPKIPRRLGSMPRAPYRLMLPSGRSLIEFPLATARFRGWSLPVGGGSYWRVLPGAVLQHALRRTGSDCASLYFHPYECDPQALRAPLPPKADARQRLRAGWYNLRYSIGRERVLPRLERVARHFPVTSYHDALEKVRRDPTLRTRSLSPAGDIV